MDSLAKKIADAIGKYHVGFMQKKVLKTIEEIEATTDPLEKYIAGAGPVDELYNKLDSLIPYKFKDIQVDVPANTSGAYIKVPDANNIIAATLIYLDSAYYLKPIVLLNGKYINILCNEINSEVHTIKIRVVYI